MGGSQTKQKSIQDAKEVKELMEKVRQKEGEINEIMYVRESDNQAYEKEMMLYAFKEAKWKKERKKLREEVKRLRKRLEVKEEKIKGMELEGEMVGGEKKSEKESQIMVGNNNNGYSVEHLNEERAFRDEAVEKWKRLYLAIKIELDDLIQRTNQGESLYWRAQEEELMDELHRELKAKQETIELLQAKMTSMKQEEHKRERELDILRQSLKIISYHKKSIRIAKGHSKGQTLKQKVKILGHLRFY